MPSTPIRAVDEIRIPAPPERVWPLVSDLGGYARWWPPSVRVQAVPGSPAIELRPRGGRPFRCRTEEAEAPRRLRIRYEGGFIEGTGEWRLEPAGADTRVVYALDVRAHGVLAWLLGKAVDLGRVHSRSMQDVLACLRREAVGDAPG